MTTRVCLAATCHDPKGAFASGVAATSEVLRSVLVTVAVNATAETSPDTVQALTTAHPTASVRRHAAGSIGIGTARRDALALALTTDCTHVVYSDLDHVLRWAGTAPAELPVALVPDPEADLVVIGRSRAAFAAEPARLRATEGVVNHVVALALGNDEDWDLMIAVRLLTRATAELLVAESEEESIANDVTWPLLAVRRGRRLGYRPVDGLAYRFREDFGADGDVRDDDPREWVTRTEIAARHLCALRPFLDPQG